MKITKRQLRRIIKEEKQKLREEPREKKQKMSAFVDMLQAVETYAELTSPENARDELQILIDDLQAEIDAGDEPEWDEADQDNANQEYINQYGDPYNEGASLDQMPSAWQQILGKCLKEKK